MPIYHTYAFEKLEIYKLARHLRKEIYIITRSFPREELFGLTSQLRRSTASIADNIAEGSGKATAKDQARFTNIAYSSGLESINHLIGALDLQYISENEYGKLRQDFDKVLLMLTRLYNAQINRDNGLKGHYLKENLNNESDFEPTQP